MQIIRPLICFLLIYISFYAQSQSFIVDNTPKWVKHIEIPKKSKFSKYDISAGYYHTLLSQQYNLSENISYIRQVRNVLSHSGITNASQLSITLDTSYQNLVIHHLYILRNGKKIDRTKDLDFEIMNKEDELNVGIYTGLITAYDILDDIRKEDKIDFAYSLEGENPIFDNEKHKQIKLVSSNPTDLLSVIFVFNRSGDFQSRYYGSDSSSINRYDSSEWHYIEISKPSLDATVYDRYVPEWYLPEERITISSVDSWADVNEWAEKVFKLEEVFEPSPVFEEILLGGESQNEKINKIIDYVQDEIRYMGIEGGIGSIQPFHPNTVVAQRYGDCKDKSLLLVKLLHAIGIEKAYPVLANTITGRYLKESLPGNQAFNHVIVSFELDSTVYWIDPTISQQGGDFQKIYTPDYKYVLVVGNESDSLTEMNKLNKAGIVRGHEVIEITKIDNPAKISITTQSKGFFADKERSILDYLPKDAIEKRITDNLKHIYPKINLISETKITDKPENNSFTMQYFLEGDDYWKEEVIEGVSYTYFWYTPWILSSYLYTASCSEREYPYEIQYPNRLEYYIEIHLPEEVFYLDSYDCLDNDFILFEETIEQFDLKTIHAHYKYEAKQDHIDADQYEAVCEEINELVKTLSIGFYFK